MLIDTSASFELQMGNTDVLGRDGVSAKSRRAKGGSKRVERALGEWLKKNDRA
jgi:hypothetical protein